MRRTLLPLALALPLLAGADARAAWLPNGTPICTEPHEQDLVAAVPDGAGGAVIVYADDRDAGHPGAIYAQRVLVDGSIAPGWPLDGRPVCVDGRAEYITAVPDGEGGALVFWNTSDLFAQHVTGAGTIAPGWGACGLTVCAGPLVEYVAAAIPDGAGGAFVAWQDNRADESDIYVQHIGGSGALAWAATGMPACRAHGFQSGPKLVSDGGSGIYVTWEDGRTATTRVYGQHVDATGSIVAGWPTDGRPMGTGIDGQYMPALAGDGAGGAYFAWSWSSNHAVFHPMLQRLTAAGTVVAGWPASGVQLCNLYESQTLPSLVEDGGGGVFVTWLDWRDFVNPELNYDLYAQHVLASGALAPGWPVNGTPVCTAPRNQQDFVTTSDRAGGLLLAWQDGRNGTNDDVFAQRLDPGGQVAMGWSPDGNALTSAPGYQQFPRIVPSAPGGAIVAWTDSRVGFEVSQRDIYAARTLDDAVVAARLALVSVVTEPGRVRLLWEGTTGFPATLERCGGASAWRTLAMLDPDGQGRYAFEDRDVAAGERYGYRLALGAGSGARRTEETWVEVPAALALGLEVAETNPAAGRVAFDVTLPDGTDGRLRLFDVSGREVVAREVGGAGRRRIEIDARRIAPGLYFARLSHAGRSVVARACVIR